MAESTPETRIPLSGHGEFLRGYRIQVLPGQSDSCWLHEAERVQDDVVLALFPGPCSDDSVVGATVDLARSSDSIPLAGAGSVSVGACCRNLVPSPLFRAGHGPALRGSASMHAASATLALARKASGSFASASDSVDLPCDRDHPGGGDSGQCSH